MTNFIWKPNMATVHSSRETNRAEPRKYNMYNVYLILIPISPFDWQVSCATNCMLDVCARAHSTKNKALIGLFDLSSYVSGPSANLGNVDVRIGMQNDNLLQRRLLENMPTGKLGGPLMEVHLISRKLKPEESFRSQTS